MLNVSAFDAFLAVNFQMCNMNMVFSSFLKVINDNQNIMGFLLSAFLSVKSTANTTPCLLCCIWTNVTRVLKLSLTCLAVLKPKHKSSILNYVCVENTNIQKHLSFSWDVCCSWPHSKVREKPFPTQRKYLMIQTLESCLKFRNAEASPFCLPKIIVCCMM